MERRSFTRRELLSLGAAVCGAQAAQACGWFASRPPRRPYVKVPGMVVAHVHRDKEFVFEARGDLTPDSVLEVASLSKPVFALALVSMAVRGALDLDAPLSSFAAPPFPHAQRHGEDLLTDPRFAALTPRMLLSHQSGLPNWSRTAPLTFESPPGSAWHYSGEGYVLLQRVIEKARHESLDALVRREVFGPLHMQNSTYNPNGGLARKIGHERDGSPEESSLVGENAASSLLSCANDLARFAARLAAPPPFDPVMKWMTTRQVQVDKARGLSWGLGLGLAEPEWFFHWGANPGFRSLLVGSLARGEAIVIVADSDAGMEVAANDVRDRFGDLPLLSFPMMYPPD